MGKVAKSCIPGYDEALGVERKLREEAFLSDTVSICGIIINQVTPFLLARLFRMRTPFLSGGEITPAEIVRFLWAMSPTFSVDARADGLAGLFWSRRDLFIRQIRKRLDAVGYYEAEDEIESFLNDTFLDSPDCGPETVPMVSSIAWIVAQMASDPFRWDEQRTLHSPLRRIYQYMKCVRRSRGDILHNPISDPIKENWLAEIRAKSSGGNN